MSAPIKPATDIERLTWALWHPYGLDDDEQLVLSFQRPGGPMQSERFGTCAELNDYAEQLTASPNPPHVWLNVASRRPGQGRGGNGDLLRVPALWADFDIAEGAEGIHKGDHIFATYADAEAVLNERLAPELRPSAVVNSGYGLQPWWLLDEPAAADEVAPMLAAFKATMARVSDGRADPTVFERTRMMRLPGTLNVKRPDAPRQARIVSLDAGRRFSLRDLEDSLDLPPAPPERPPAAAGDPQAVPRGIGRPGDDYSAQATTESVVELLARHGCVETERDDRRGRLVVKMARPGKDPSQGCSLTVGYLDEGVTHMFSSGWAELPAGTWTPFRLYAQLEHGGDHSAAARALAAAGYGERKADDPSRFLDPREGLKVQTLARAVIEHVPIARLRIQREADDDDALWVYDRGCWHPGGATAIERATVDLLGERYRKSHTANVLPVIRAAELPELHDGPPHPDLLNMRNGMFNCRTGELLPHDPSYRSTVQLDVEYDPDAECPNYDKWLLDVMPADAQWYADEVFGYLLMNGNPYHRAFMLRGTGRNGKGTWLRLMKAVLGERNVATVPLQTLGGNRFAAADLHMKVANIAGDLDAGRVEDTSTFKMITGGDPIRAERKYAQPFRFTAWAVPIFGANTTPGSDDTSEGYLSRWEVLPFPTSFVGRTDPSIEARLHGELEGIARRGIEGLSRLLARGGFQRPPSVAAAHEQFSADIDRVRAWIAQDCIREPDAWTERGELYARFQVWCLEAGHGDMSRATFYARLDAAGLTTRTRRGRRGYAAVRLRHAGDPPPLDATTEAEEASEPW